ncbi:1,4-alpha-glucan branching protein GlgB [Pedobacter deserti]|uniref:1,4-alpha-glucan branching protein GlgB n=1 Tax=Pedobacter deserti TaxID=2817382 RepID=UPI002108E33A|nr:1,4-alpha-glucan branching protein GlgB [Pedobacter sp. SYSU D00382]
MDSTLVNYTSYSLFSEYDIHLFKAGKHYHLFNKLGAHQIENAGVRGVYFAVWAPNARYVSVVGNFNGWDRDSHRMNVRWDGSGIWECFIPELPLNELYKYYIEGNNGYQVEKTDPYASYYEVSPGTASITWSLDYQWNDTDWMAKRAAGNALERTMSIYELHLGSWRRPAEGNRYLTYRELAAELPGYCKYMNFTHVEFMPVMEHPFYGSWGYQITGFFAPTSRYGTPQDFMYLIDCLHQEGIGVILDWVPSHFPTDENGLGYFDGTHLFEYEDTRKGFHPDWKSLIFDLTRFEVRAFLLSNALYWLEKFHIDGLRVDAVASMLYLDYSRRDGEWVPNIHGGRENLEAIDFLKEFNTAVHNHHPDVITIAEESTSWPGVTHSAEHGGLGFDLKWMMGWMHDTLDYLQRNPFYRKHHQGQLTFSMMYAFSERFVLPLSHDEIVYGKHSLISKMPGDEWQQFANLRLLFAYMYGHPGAKLIFMGGEFAQRHEWRHDFSLDWDENLRPANQGIQKLVKDLNGLYQSLPALYQHNYGPQGFEWINPDDAERSIISWVRKAEGAGNYLIFVANFTPEVRRNFRIGVPAKGFFEEVLNTDDSRYGGSGVVNDGLIGTSPIPYNMQTHSILLTLPPLGVTIIRCSDGVS